MAASLRIGRLSAFRFGLIFGPDHVEVRSFFAPRVRDARRLAVRWARARCPRSRYPAGAARLRFVGRA